MAPNLYPPAPEDLGRARAAIVRYLKRQGSRVAAEPGGAPRGAALAELASLVECQPASELLTGVLAAMHGATGSDIYAPGEHAGRELAAYGVQALPPAGSLAREALDGEFLGAWSQAAVKDLEIDGIADDEARDARRRDRPGNYSGPEPV